MGSRKRAEAWSLKRDAYGRGDDTLSASITVMEAFLNCHGPIQPGHRCESVRWVKIVIDETYSVSTKLAAVSGSDTKRVVETGSGNKLAVASGSGMKRAAVSDSDSKLAVASGSKRNQATPRGTKRHQATPSGTKRRHPSRYRLILKKCLMP
ncbi:hypothetical protein GUJ93_ZPchr0007g4941 [Zizania palustris]|uniref:Uncharacterized protein n=1 Tax=Zizania palustris TaxID=103762 RepID=A0A8J5SV75_ZIZPA|nr:hypothetical protein GUJ93_ZPchr0007g4941 [Zizania palustris]